MRLLSITLVFFGLILSSHVKAAETYHFDKKHTQILFFVDHLGFSKSQGEFLDYDGEFILDRETPENSSVQIAINTDSINMDDEEWDTHLRGPDFFNVELHPKMSFKSTKVKVLDENNAEITGDLTLLGVTKPVTLTMKHNKSGEHPKSKQFVAGFSGSTVIKRSEFGMNYGLPFVGDEVEVRLEVEGYKQDNQEN